MLNTPSLLHPLLTTYIIQTILSLLIVESSVHELRDEAKGSTDDKESGYGMLCLMFHKVTL